MTEAEAQHLAATAPERMRETVRRVRQHMQDGDWARLQVHIVRFPTPPSTEQSPAP